MNKRKSALLMAAAMSLNYAAMPVSASFADTKGHWAETFINRWQEEGIVAGDGENFRPGDSMTRGEFAVVLNKIMQYQTKAANKFTDLQNGTWYTDAMLASVQAGVFAGNGNGTISPKANISRQDVAVLITKVLNLNSNAAAAKSYDDYSQISDYAKGAMGALVENGMMVGFNNKLNPKSDITRAEVMTILDGAFAQIIKAKGTYQGDVDGNLVINAADVVIENATIQGDLIISEGVGNGDVTLDGVTVTGQVIVRGGGKNSIHVKGKSKIGNIHMERRDGGVRLNVSGGEAQVGNVSVNHGAKDVKVEGNVDRVSISAENAAITIDGVVDMVTMNADAQGTSLDVAEGAKVADLKVEAPAASVSVSGTVTNATVGTAAQGTSLDVAQGAKVTDLTVKASGTELSVSGTVTKATVTETASNVTLNAEKGGKVTNLTTDAAGMEVTGAGTVSNVTVGENATNTEVTTNNTKVENNSSESVTTNKGEVSSGTSGSSGTASSGSNPGSSSSGGSVSGGGNTGSGGNTVTDTTAPTVSAVVVTLNDGKTIGGTIENGDITVNCTVGDKVEKIEITMSENVKLSDDIRIDAYNGETLLTPTDGYGTVTVTGNVLTIVPHTAAATASETGTVTFKVTAGDILDAAGNKYDTTKTITLNVKLPAIPKENIKAGLLNTDTDNTATTEAKVEAGEGNTFTIKLTHKNLPETTNENGNASKSGHWVGFYVKVPEGVDADQVKYSFGGSSGTTTVDTLGRGDNAFKGIAFYANLDDDAPKTTGTFQFMKSLENAGAAGYEAVTQEYSFVMDLDGVKYEGKKQELAQTAYGVANVAADGSKEYTTGGVELKSVTKGSDGVYTVTLESQDETTLPETKKGGNGELGYWTGFYVKAPEDADSVKYSFNSTGCTETMSETLTPLETYLDGKAETKGIAFYANLADENPKTYVTLQFYKGNDPLTYVYKYEMNLEDVDYLDTITAGNIKAGLLRNDEGNTATTKAEVEAGEGNTFTVNLKHDALPKTTNEDTNPTEGHWVGFYVEVPEGVDADYVEYSFGGSEKAIIPVETLGREENSPKGIAFYANMDDETPKTNATVQFLKHIEGNTYLEITDTYTFNMNLDDVMLAVEDYGVARLAGDAQQDAVSMEMTAGDENIVKLTSKALPQTTNSEGEKGNWVGFYVVAPKGADKVKYSFTADKFGTLGDAVDLETYLDGKEDTKGIAFYANKGAEVEKKYAVVQFYKDGKAITAEYKFRMDLSSVTLAETNAGGNTGAGENQ